MTSLSTPEFRSLDQFELKTAVQICKGSFGFVKATRCVDDGMVYVLNTVNLAYIAHQSSDDEEARQRKQFIFDKVQKLLEMSHPYFVATFGSFLVGDSDDGTLYVVMEYCGGRRLIEWIEAAEEDFEEKQILNWTGQLLNGLSFLHTNNYLHGDIKAENIVLDPEGRIAKLGNFEFSKLSQKSAMMALGTSSHVPPEILRGQEYTAESDVWSLGALIFHLCSRRPPFPKNENVVSLLRQITDQSEPLPVIPNHNSPALRDIIQRKLLVRDPDNRASVAELCSMPPFKRYVRKWNTNFNPELLEKANEELEETVEKLENELKQERMEKQTLQRENQTLTKRVAELEAKIGANETPSSATNFGTTLTSQTRTGESKREVVVVPRSESDLQSMNTLEPIYMPVPDLMLPVTSDAPPIPKRPTSWDVKTGSVSSRRANQRGSSSSGSDVSSIIGSVSEGPRPSYVLPEPIKMKNPPKPPELFSLSKK